MGVSTRANKDAGGGLYGGWAYNGEVDDVS